MEGCRGPGQRPNLPGSAPGVLLSWASSGQRWSDHLLQTATPRAASPELQTHLHGRSTFPGAGTTCPHSHLGQRHPVTPVGI